MKNKSTQVEAEYIPDMASFLDGFLQRTDNILAGGQFTICVCPSLNIFAQCASSDSHVVTINQVVLEQVSKNLWSS